ncbi:MAG: ATP-binding protein [bacterium]
MKQIVIISGKGGTGKTVITAGFAALAKNKVMADCDVDAADLHLLLHPRVRERHEFKSGKVAGINKEICKQCNKCIDICRFSAISKDFMVDTLSCEGCAFCSNVCPVEAISMEEKISGEWFISDTKYGPFVHAKLDVAEGNSGKLVSLIRQKAKEIAQNKGSDWVIIDGSPGIGCPVIASLSGIDCARVVTEPTLSGLHDADRVIGVAKYFGVPVKLVVNKYDLNIDMTKKIEEYCEKNDIQVAGKVGFDESVVKSIVEGRTILEFPDGKAGREITEIWARLEKEMLTKLNEPLRGLFSFPMAYSE